MRLLEGALCATLPPFVVDKYFGASSNTERFRTQTAKAICARCVVLSDCRKSALDMDRLPQRGVIGGVAVGEIRRARAWRNYELGQRATPPDRGRPEWLSRPDAVEVVEQGLIEAEEGVER